jgi:hypothetical protein
MAITINSTPNNVANYPSAHDDAWFVVTSTNVAQTNFKYVFDIYVNGNFAATLKSFPDPSTGKGFLNVSNIARNYMNSYFVPSTTVGGTAFTYTAEVGYLEVEVQFGEEYGGSTYPNLNLYSIFLFNYYPRLFSELGPDYLYSEYTYDQNSLYLSNRDLTQLKAFSPSRLYIPLLSSQANSGATNMKIVVEGYNPTTNTWTTWTGNNVATYTYTQLDVSPTALNTYFGFNYINSNISKYKVKVQIDNDYFLTELEVENACSPRYGNTAVHFLNALGGYETINFDMIRRKSGSFERKSFERMMYQYDSTSQQMRNINASRRLIYPGTSTFFVNETVNFRLVSDYVNEIDFDFFKELLASPEVYIEQSFGYFPITISDSQWTQKRKFADKVFNLELNVEYGKKMNSQYR